MWEWLLFAVMVLASAMVIVGVCGLYDWWVERDEEMW